MNDVRELQAQASIPLSMAFRDCGGAAFKMQRPLLLGDNYASQKDSRRLRRCIRPLGGAGVGKEGRGTASEVGRGGETASGRSSLQKLSRVFLLRRFPLFLSLFFARLRAAWREQIESSRMCKQQATHALSYVFHLSHSQFQLHTTSFFIITFLKSQRRLSQNSHASSRDSKSKVTSRGPILPVPNLPHAIAMLSMGPFVRFCRLRQVRRLLCPFSRLS